MRAIIDRIENGIAVAETDSGMMDVPAVPNLKDGDIVEIEGNVIVRICQAETEARRAKMQARLDRMMKKNKP